MIEQKRVVRELKNRYVGNGIIDPWLGTTSAARGAMLLGQITQAPTIIGAEQRLFQTGGELRFGEHNFDVRIPEDCQILNVVRKYPTGMGADAIRHNPETTIVYENYYDEFKTVGIVKVPEFMSFHQTFGFKLNKAKDVWDNIHPGAMVSKDTILAESAGKSKDGHFCAGMNVNACFMSHHATIEDGFWISDEILEQFAPHAYGTAIGSCGRKSFLLNAYGNKPFPDIGDRIREDGVVFAMRDLSDDLAPAEMTKRALSDIDRTFDRVVIGEPGAIVKDIKIYRDERQNPSFIPSGMEPQLVKYYDALCMYYREILRIYNDLKKKRKDRLRISDEFNQLIVEALIYLPQAEGQRKLTRMYRLEPLDEWRIEITYESLKQPGGAYKITDFFGGKGVVCKTSPRSEMPRDEFGNIADVVIFGGSTMRRSNYGRIYEHGFGATVRDLCQRLRVEAGFDRHAELNNIDFAQSKAFNDPAWIEYAFNEFQELWWIIAPTMHEIMKEHPNHKEYVKSALRQGTTVVYTPIDDTTHLPTAMNTIINTKFRPNYTPVTYTDPGGRVVTTKNNVLIGPLYMMLLEKIGDDWSSVASVKVQQFGLPSKLNNFDRSSTPGRESAVRSFGESETRSYNCTVGPEPTMELVDQTNNPLAHVEVVEQFLTQEKPTRIDRAVDRKKIPFGNSRPVSLLNHMMQTRGIEFKYASSPSASH
ncbi:RNA polymerase beta subunit [Pseudomonas phage 201phi2-1]|uniref:DNA-directed RNA polymerase n=1 Tax=Pseudomonas phage 201phi2-1 TaxID=198110 RepID=B3FIZ2_BP201|nr:RNA polymerase beta subunit [Pseudomonas phage 201phi2-1]ABY62961.1 hypothetical protein 201phi2-1p129 [Pseudomonas phage 201phi2-1]